MGVSRVSFSGAEKDRLLTRKSGMPAFVEIPAPARMQMLEAGVRVEEERRSGGQLNDQPRRISEGRIELTLTRLDHSSNPAKAFIFVRERWKLELDLNHRRKKEVSERAE